MSPPPRKAPQRGPALSSDATLGIVGGCLAAAAATFGVAMSMHGPVVGLGSSGNFTVFAQFAPRSAPRRASTPGTAERPDFSLDELDRTATASIPARREDSSVDEGAATVILQSASGVEATILVDGAARTVRVGDVIPGAGEVLSILGGNRPLLRTSRRLIAGRVARR